MRKVFLLLGLLFATQTYAQTSMRTHFEQSNGTESATYAQGIAYYEMLANHFDTIQLQAHGKTDSGKPLHLVLYSADQDFDIHQNRKKGRSILLINNAIHAGEPDGVDASMMLLRDIAQLKLLKHEVNNVLIGIIPFYNIGGVLNRNSTTRTNQNGPAEYGFRGNAKNYDLNRDFIKTDSLNMRAFAKIFHSLDPDILIDTHVSNGADYQHVMTIDHPQKDKLGGVLGRYTHEYIMPELYSRMKNEQFEMIPYVNAWGATPDNGWVQFMDWPRYSSGYAALFHTIGFMSESHMLKPYNQRVQATYALLKSAINFLSKNGQHLQALRKKTKKHQKNQTEFEIRWKPDKSKYSQITFKGYEAEQHKSKVTGSQRLVYNRDKPYTKLIPYYDHFVADISVQKPTAYIFSSSWQNIADLMRLNNVNVKQLKKDKTLEVEVYYILDYKTYDKAYEGHYPHSNVQIESKKQTLSFKKNDFIIEMNQANNRYIIETLEPQAYDSFFNWNFFDTYLQQKEHFSSYVFEDIAERLLSENDELRKALHEKKQNDDDFAQDSRAQLDFIYKRSPHHEPEHLRYPVFRVP